MLRVILLLALPALSAQAADKETVQFVERVIKTPTADLPPGRIPDFLAVDPAGLPEALRRPYEAKKVELNARKHMMERKRSGFVRAPEPDCTIPKDAKSQDAGILKMAGFSELLEEEKSFIEEKSKCSEQDLLCESSLQIAIVRDPKTNKVKQRRFFMAESDPMMAFVATYRSGKKVGGQTNFFSRGGPFCTH